MTILATASFLREATSPEALTRARRRLLIAHSAPTRANTPTPGSLTDEQLRVLAAHDWAPPHIAALDTNTLTTAAPITRAILAESVRETLERRLAAERPHGTYDDTRAGHDAFSRGLVEDYDHGNHHLARATIRVADPGLVTCAGLSHLGLPDTDATIIDELARASDLNPIASVLADAALLDLDRYATGRGLRYSRVGTALMLAAPNDQRLADAIDAVAAAAINAGARVTDTTAHMHAWRRSLAGARTLDEIMAIEGACSNAYFDALSACVPADVTFDGRSRRPPRDLPNAALSYGYAILLSECLGALHAAGLEPSLGIAHAPTDKRSSLALDLMEQFRPLHADAGARHRRTRLPVERGHLAMIYIIAYDIADNKRRLRVAKTLESWSYRIQESVFQLRLDSTTLARVRLLLAALISDSEDVIHIYPICSSCADRADILGAAIALDDVGLCRGVW